MRPSITSFVAAILLFGTVTADAQDTESGIAAVQTPSTHQSGARARKARTASAHNATGSSAVSPDVSVEEGGAGVRLPNVFRNCEEPLPWFCARPTGSLWFGSVATLQHHRRAASFQGRREFSRWSSMGPYY
jgi:hypothetical protein